MESDIKTMGIKAREYYEGKFEKKRLMDEMDQYFKGIE